MAENESLDLSKARRWQSVVQSIRSGSPVEDTAEKVRDCLYKTMRAVRNQIPLEEMIEALDDPSRLHELVRHSYDGRDYAELLEHIAADGKGRQETIETYLFDVFDEFADQITHIIVPHEHWPHISGIRKHLNEVRTIVTDEMRRMASKFAEDPGWNPRRTSSPKDQPKPDRTKEMLDESLILGFRR